VLVLELDGDLAAGVAAEEGDAGRRRRGGLRREERAHAQHDAHRLRRGRGGSSGCGGGRHRREDHGEGCASGEAAGARIRYSESGCGCGSTRRAVGDWGRRRPLGPGTGRRFEFEHGRRCEGDQVELMTDTVATSDSLALYQAKSVAAWQFQHGRVLEMGLLVEVSVHRRI
jgi:hypothetical protein